MADKQYLNPPDGYRITGNPVAKSDYEALRAYAHSLRTTEDVEYHSMIDTLDKPGLHKYFESQGFDWQPLENSNWKTKDVPAHE